MADWSLSACERVEALTPTLCNIGAANAKGAWAQVTAATSFQYDALQVDLMESASSGGVECFLVDIAVGASGSEVVVVPNILFDVNRSGQGCLSIHLSLPLSVRAGSRIAVRCQCIGGAGTRIMRATLTGKAGGANYPRACCGAITTYGAITASTNGTLVDQGAVASTWGAWTQITAATSANHNFIQAVLGNNQQTVSTGSTVDCDFQIAVGAAAAEQIIGQGSFGAEYSVGYVGSFEPIYPFIPAGSRLSMRTRSTLAAAADRNMTFILLAG
jgi:hypothetical protein